MKSNVSVVFIIATLFLASTASAAEDQLLKDERDRISYSIGLSIGLNFKKQSIDVTLEPLMAGVRDAMLERKPLLTDQELKETMDRFRKQMNAKLKAKKASQANQNLAAGQQFLKENSKKEGVITTESGLQYEVIKEGSGKKPTLNDTVVTHYTGTLLNGKVFDSSYKRNEPATFPVNGVIKGWTEALQMMKPGSKWKLYVPSNLAYGERGAGNVIGPNATLIFEIELLDIK